MLSLGYHATPSHRGRRFAQVGAASARSAAVALASGKKPVTHLAKEELTIN